MSGETSVLITGGEGFIGFHFCQALIDHGFDEIVTYDAHKNWVSGPKTLWSTCHSLRVELFDEVVTRVKGDTTNQRRLREVLERYQPDVVVQLAALPIATVCTEEPEAARQNILDGTLTLLNTVRNSDLSVDRLMYVSSSMVYGDFNTDESGNIVPANEDQECKPKNLYGALKLSGEHLVRSYGREHNLSYTIIRPSAVYGPTDCNRRVVEIFLRRAFNNEPLRLDNGGQHELDFTYVTDTAKGLALAVTKKAAENETFNITRGEGRSICELATIIDKHVGDVETYTEKKERTRPQRGALDISKARRLLGFDPKYSLEDGIESYVEFVERHGTLNQRDGESKTTEVDVS